MREGDVDEGPHPQNDEDENEREDEGVQQGHAIDQKAHEYGEVIDAHVRG